MSSTPSPNHEGSEGRDSEVVWIFTEPSAILVISPSLLRTVGCFLFKEAYFYTSLLHVISRCASRGKISEEVRFARLRFGHYEVIDFLAVLFGYVISGERTLEAFYESLQPFAVSFMAGAGA
jgi:hypothetical protein